jgi:cupin fold WbuC family metalloprotein
MIKIDSKLITEVSEKAQTSSRKRMNFNFHEVAEDTLHRMINSLCIGTYIRPHKHENPGKREAFILLSGEVLIVEFDEIGNITQHFKLDQKDGNYGAEIAPGTFHTLICLSENAVIYEVKDGPYDVKTDKAFASWSPEEGHPEEIKFINNLLNQLNYQVK